MSLIFAHRGASGYAPENTMPSFDLAQKMGADGFELDVHLSADGHLVVIHDETLDRTTDGTGYICNKSFSEIRKLNASYGRDAYSYARIPELEEVLDLIRGNDLLINIEIKTDIIQYKGIEEKCLDTVASLGIMDKIIFSSFNHYSLYKIRTLSPSAKIGVLYSDGLYNSWKYALDLKADFLHPYWPNIYFENYVRDAKNAKLGINAWTVNDIDTIRFCLKNDIGIITNFPDIAIKESALKR